MTFRTNTSRTSPASTTPMATETSSAKSKRNRQDLMQERRCHLAAPFCFYYYYPKSEEYHPKTDGDHHAGHNLLIELLVDILDAFHGDEIGYHHRNADHQSKKEDSSIHQIELAIHECLD